MGSVVAAAVDDEVVWAGENRSAVTHARAEESGARDVGTLEAVAKRSDVVFSVCPPAAALDVAIQFNELGFGGIYVDANAIAPQTSLRISGLFGRFVDGSVVGPPPRHRGDARLYLSGVEAGSIASLFDGSSFDARVIGTEPGRASALKMAYAGWTKGTSALLLAIAALAHGHGVLDELLEEWGESIQELPRRLEATASRVGRKAWRFEGEMSEIASAFAALDLPDGFHEAAGQVYASLAGIKDADGPESIEEIIALVSGLDPL